jgi:hypothetical protein
VFLLASRGDSLALPPTARMIPVDTHAFATICHAGETTRRSELARVGMPPGSMTEEWLSARQPQEALDLDVGRSPMGGVDCMDLGRPTQAGCSRGARS